MRKTKRNPIVKKPGSIERELRLAGNPAALQAVFDAPLMASKGGQSDKTFDLDTRYFDTPGHELQAKGLAFRVRRTGTNYRQTLKFGDDAHAVLLKRGEWETPLDDDQPRPDALPKKALRLLPATARNGGLAEIFTTEVQRQSRQLIIDAPNQPATIEAALDLGEIKSGAGTLPVAEIELELLDGQPQSLYRLAVDLQEIAPLHLETRSKSTRAYDAIAGRPPCWHRAKPLSLTRACSVNETMAVIFESCFEQWLANHAAAVDGRDPEGVHQMRVGLRRLRSALSIFRELIPKTQLDWLQAGAKRTINCLGDARDWDVFQQDLLSPVIAAHPRDRALLALRDRAKTRGQRAYRAARKSLEGADYIRFTLCFGQWLEERAWVLEQDAEQTELGAMLILAFAKKLQGKRRDKALARGEGFAGLSVAERHRLRIAQKKLRYAVEFFLPLFDKRAVKPFLRRLKTLQDDLGHMNDIAVAGTLLNDLLARPGKLDIGRAAGLVIGWHARGAADLEPGMIRRWSAFAERRAFWA